MRRAILLAALVTNACGGDDGATAIDAATDGAEPPPTCDADAGVAGDGTETTPGEITAPYPTLRHLTLEWAITGDRDLDATVTVRVRSAAGIWRTGAPLRRIPAGSVANQAWANRFSGSVFDLDPATTYEVELALRDPDGGCEVRTLTATTRAIPAPAPGAPIIPVTTTTFTDVAAAANPGDILQLAAGTYPTFTFQRDGAAGQPIVIRGGPGVIIDGDVRLDGRHHVHVDGLTIHGQIKLNGAADLAIVRNDVTAVTDGIVTKTRAENLYIADNVVTGVTPWTEAALGASGANTGEGIEVTGPGHVIEHNRVSGFRDDISLIEDDNAVDQFSIDIVGNDLRRAADDAIEADFCFHNCRIADNRITDAFIAMSSQPGLGGPTYFLRNVAYNVLLSPFKLQRGSVGDVLLHNTVVKSGDAFGIYTTDVFARQYARNNLFLGGPGRAYNGYDIGDGAVIELRAADASGDYDHDGFGSATGAFSGRLGAAAFTSLDELRARTTEVHAVAIDASVFATPPAIPADALVEHTPPDLRLAAGGAAVDTGVSLPGIDRGVTGAAPDLGAYEQGAALPGYGPR